MASCESDVLARCTTFAAEQLVRLRSHPQYQQLIEQLRAIPPRGGVLFWADIERALLNPPVAQRAVKQVLVKA
jgi:hypothetical protein